MPDGAPLPAPDDVDALDADPLRCFDAATSAAMVARVDDAHDDGDTLGGVVEVLAYGVPPGLGSLRALGPPPRRQLAGALMGIQAIKGVEVGDGFETTRRRGSAGARRARRRRRRCITPRSPTGRAAPRAACRPARCCACAPAMKPIATVPHALRTVDVATGEAAAAHHQRSDVCAVPAAGVVAEAMVALVLADAVLEKFGGDSVAETRRNLDAYLAAIPERAAHRRLSSARVRDVREPARVVLDRPDGRRQDPDRQARRRGCSASPFIDTDAVIVAEHGPIAAALRRARRAALPGARARGRARGARGGRRRLARRRRGARPEHPRPTSPRHRVVLLDRHGARPSRSASATRKRPLIRDGIDALAAHLVDAAPPTLRRRSPTHLRHVDTVRVDGHRARRSPHWRRQDP